MKEFKTEVDLFKKETPLGVFAEVEKMIDSEIPDCFRKLTSKHTFSKDSLLKEVERVRVELKNEYRFEDCALMLNDVLPGCIEIVWLIPTSATQHVLQVTSTLEKGRFRTIMMVKLEFQGECLYEDDLTYEVHSTLYLVSVLMKQCACCNIPFSDNCFPSIDNNLIAGTTSITIAYLTIFQRRTVHHTIFQEGNTYHDSSTVCVQHSPLYIPM